MRIACHNLPLSRSAAALAGVWHYCVYLLWLAERALGHSSPLIEMQRHTRATFSSAIVRDASIRQNVFGIRCAGAVKSIAGCGDRFFASRPSKSPYSGVPASSRLALITMHVLCLVSKPKKTCWPLRLWVCRVSRSLGGVRRLCTTQLKHVRPSRAHQTPL